MRYDGCDGCRNLRTNLRTYVEGVCVRACVLVFFWWCVLFFFVFPIWTFRAEIYHHIDNGGPPTWLAVYAAVGAAPLVPVCVCSLPGCCRQAAHNTVLDSQSDTTALEAHALVIFSIIFPVNLQPPPCYPVTLLVGISSSIPAFITAHMHLSMPHWYLQPTQLFKFYCRFFTHAFANAVVCVTGAKAIWTVFSDPHDAMDFRIYHDTSPFGSASVWYVCINEPHQQQQHHYIFPLRIFIYIFLHSLFLR